MLNTVMYFESSSSSILWKLSFMSIFEKTWAPFSSMFRSSGSGIGCLVLRMASLACLLSAQMRYSPFSLRTGTMQETHGVGPVTFLKTPSCSMLFNFSPTLSGMWNGVCLCFCLTGCTDVSIFNFIFTFFSLPSLPLKTSGYIDFSWQLLVVQASVVNVCLLELFVALLMVSGDLSVIRSRALRWKYESRLCALPFMTRISTSTYFEPHLMGDVKRPSTSRRLFGYPKTTLSICLNSGLGISFW